MTSSLLSYLALTKLSGLPWNERSGGSRCYKHGKINLWHWELWDDDTKFIIWPTILLLQRLEDSVLYSGQIEENKSAGLCSAKRRFLLRQQQKAVISDKSLRALGWLPSISPHQNGSCFFYHELHSYFVSSQANSVLGGLIYTRRETYFSWLYNLIGLGHYSGQSLGN